MGDHGNVTIRFSGDKGPLDSVINGIKGSVDALKNQIEGIASAGKWVLGFMAVEHEMHKALEHRREMDVFRAVLESNGLAADVWADKLEHAAKALAEVTGESRHAAMQAMEMGLNMGISGDKLIDTTKQAAALSAVTHHGIVGSMRMLSMAQEGRFEMFRRWIPNYKDLTSDEEKMAAVNQLLLKGWQQAKTDTPAKEIERLKDDFSSLRKVIGEAFIPSLIEWTRAARAMIIPIKEWISENRELVVKIVSVTAAVAGLTLLGPKLWAMFEKVGSVIMWLVSTPMGLLITSVGAVAAGLAYTMGVGDTFFARMKDGFQKLGVYIDKAVGSWGNFKTTMQYLGDSVVNIFAQMWERIKSGALDAWTYMVEQFKEAWSVIPKWYYENIVIPMSDHEVYYTGGMHLSPEAQIKELIAGRKKMAKEMGLVYTQKEHELTDEEKKAAIRGEYDPLEQFRTGRTYKIETNVEYAKRYASEGQPWAKDWLDKRHGDVKAQKKTYEDRIAALQDEQNLRNKEYQNKAAEMRGFSQTDTGKKAVEVWDEIWKNGPLAAARKNIPVLNDWLTAAEAKFAASKAEAGEDPGLLGLVGGGQGKKAHFEAADTMYKRIASAAAGEDPIKKEIGVTNAILKALQASIHPYIQGATELVNAGLGKGKDGIKIVGVMVPRFGK